MLIFKKVIAMKYSTFRKRVSSSFERPDFIMMMMNAVFMLLSFPFRNIIIKPQYSMLTASSVRRINPIVIGIKSYYYYFLNYFVVICQT